MQPVAARRLAPVNDHEAAAADPSRDPEVLAAYRQRFSWAAAGALDRARLEELWAAAGVGGAVEVERGYGGLRGWPMPAGGGWWRMGCARRRRREEPVETRTLYWLVLAYYQVVGVGRAGW